MLLLLASISNLQEVNVGSLFFAAAIPGVMLALMYMAYALFYAWRHPDKAPAMSMKASDLTFIQLFLRTIKALFPPLILMVGVLGSIFFGIASPTEAAGVGAFLATLLALVKGKLNLSVLKSVMASHKHVLRAWCFIILIGAQAFGAVFRQLRGDQMIRTFFPEFECRCLGHSRHCDAGVVCAWFFSSTLLKSRLFMCLSFCPLCMSWA